jgi:hypothetical protein
MAVRPARSESQRAELVCCRRCSVFDVAEFALADHVRDLDAGEQNSGAAKGLEAEHWPCDAFDGAVVLFDDVVEVLRLAHLDGQTAIGLDAHDGGSVGCALVDRDLVGHAVQVDGAFEERPGRGVISFGAQQEVDSVAVAVDRAVQVLPLAADLHVGLVHPPASTHRTLAPAERSSQHRQHFHRPAMQRGVIDEDPALGHHLLDVSKAQRVGRVPTHAHQLHFERVVHTLNHSAQRFDHLRTVKLHRLTLPARAYRDRTE